MHIIEIIQIYLDLFLRKKVNMRENSGGVSFIMTQIRFIS